LKINKVKRYVITIIINEKDSLSLLPRYHYLQTMTGYRTFSVSSTMMLLLYCTAYLTLIQIVSVRGAGFLYPHVAPWRPAVMARESSHDYFTSETEDKLLDDLLYNPQLLSLTSKETSGLLDPSSFMKSGRSLEKRQPPGGFIPIRGKKRETPRPYPLYYKLSPSEVSGLWRIFPVYSDLSNHVGAGARVMGEENELRRMKDADRLYYENLASLGFFDANLPVKK